MKSTKGFSLLETMVVVALLGIMAAIALSSMMSYRNNSMLADAVSMIQADFEKARSRAIRENALVVVTLNTNSSTNAYQIFIDNGSGGGTAENGTRDGTENILCDASLPSGITISQTSFTDNKTCFNGRGYSTINGTLTLLDSRGKSVTIKMDNRFGRITIDE